MASGLGKLILGLKTVNRELSVLSRGGEESASRPDAGTNRERNAVPEGETAGGGGLFSIRGRSMAAKVAEAKAAAKDIARAGESAAKNVEELKELQRIFKKIEGVLYDPYQTTAGLKGNSVFASMLTELAFVAKMAEVIGGPEAKKLRKQALALFGAFNIPGFNAEKLGNQQVNNQKRGGG